MFTSWRLRLLAVLLPAVAALALPGVCAAQSYITEWGSKGLGDYRFSFPTGVAVDSQGNVYVADWGNSRIVKYTGDGTYLDQWSTNNLGGHQFSAIAEVALDAADNVYVTDPYPGGARVLKFEDDGTFLLAWGGSGRGDGQFLHPVGVAPDGLGHVFVADSGVEDVQEFSDTGGFLTKWIGTGVETFAGATGIAVSEGTVFASEWDRDRIDVFSEAGDSLGVLGSPGSHDGELRQPSGLAFGPDGLLYVADSYNHRIEVFTPAGGYVTAWGGPGSGPGEFYLPHAVAVDAVGNVFVCDTDNHRIQKFGPLTTAVPPDVFRPGRARIAASPNPTRGRMTISLDAPAASVADVALYDVAGRRVMSIRDAPLARGTTSFPWRESGLAPGVYFLRLGGPGYAATGRVVLVK